MVHGTFNLKYFLTLKLETLEMFRDTQRGNSMYFGPGCHSDEPIGDIGKQKVGHCEVKPIITVSSNFNLVGNY